MKKKEFEFNGQTYVCRVVTDNEGEELVIGGLKLLDAVHPGSFDDEDEGFAGREGERIYNKIFYFTDDKNLELSDSELVDVLRVDNPEWF